MLVRRIFYYVQLAAVVLLPGWIIVARAIAPTGLGAQDVIVFLSWPLLALAMLVVIGLTWARKAVRSTKTLSWTDVAALTVWYATSIAYGAFISVSSGVGAGLTGGLLLLVGIVVIALAVWQLLNAARRRVQTVMASLDRSAVPAGRYEATRIARGDGEVITISTNDVE